MLRGGRRTPQPLLQLGVDPGLDGVVDDDGVIVSAPGDEVDFVSRCFFPKAGIPEDPVTGSAHTTMAAYWSPKLGSKMKAKQLSARGGEVGVEVIAERVLLTGTARTFMIGEIFL